MPYKILYFRKLASTNDKAKELLEKGRRNFAVAAEMQTKGRGRFGRRWYSSKEGLWFSIALKLKSADSLKYLTFVASIAVVRAVRKAAKINAMLKWPNDIYYNGKKLCGILTEGIFGKEDFAVVGIGLNVNQKKFPKEISNAAESLRIITNKNFDKKKFLKDILNEFEGLYPLYKNKNFNEIISKWKEYSDNIGKMAEVAAMQKVFCGHIEGIDEDCSLILRLSNGKTARILEGDLRIS